MQVYNVGYAMKDNEMRKRISSIVLQSFAKKDRLIEHFAAAICHLLLSLYE